MNGRDDTAYPGPTAAFIALTRLLGRIAAQEHINQQRKMVDKKREEKSCK